MSQPTPNTAPAPRPRPIVCFGCRYPIPDIDPRAACPECGLPIRRSVGDDLLVNSPVDHVQTLHRGVVLILTCVVASILITSLFVSLILAGFTSAVYVATILTTGAFLVGAAGWWSFSKPDRLVQEHAGETARQLVRAAVVIQLAVALFILALQFASTDIASQRAVTGWTLVHMVLNLASIGAGALHFFASMVYVRWLAPRLPDERVFRRAKLLMWLCPLLMTFGLLLVIGPIVALVLYYNLLNWIRLDLKAILYEQGVD